MKGFSILLFLLWTSLGNTSLAAHTQENKNSKGTTEVVDTVSVDIFSYSCGKVQTQGLKDYLAQRMGVDTTYIKDFLKGFDQKKGMSKKDKREKARLAGIEIRSQVENQILPGVNQQIDDSVDVLIKDLFIKGFRDGLAGENMQMSMDSMQQIVSKQATYYHREKMEKRYGAHRAAGEEFLRVNATKDSVQTTPSGLQYKVFKMGTGEKPLPTQRVKVHYEGKLVDGTVFDSSYARNAPATFVCGQVIKGWIEALSMMPVGSVWELYIPQELGYGEREAGKIPPYSTLIFKVELLSIEK